MDELTRLRDSLDKLWDKINNSQQARQATVFDTSAEQVGIKRLKTGVFGTGSPRVTSRPGKENIPSAAAVPMVVAPGVR